MVTSGKDTRHHDESEARGMSEVLGKSGAGSCAELRAGDHAVILELHGEIDIDPATDFKVRMQEAVAGGHAVIVDLSDVTFIDSSGLSVLIWGERRLRERDAGLHIVCGERTRRVLAVAGLSDFFALYEDRDEAVRTALAGAGSEQTESGAPKADDA
jgi:anti-anti-sigma factor